MRTLSRAERLEIVEEALDLLSEVGRMVEQLRDPWLDAYLTGEFEASSDQGSSFGGTADKLAYYAANLQDDEDESYDD